MKIYHSLNDIKDMPDQALALGNFDGVHLGHQALIRKTVAGAKNKGLQSCVFTFSNHPRDLIPGKEKVKNILYKGERQKILQDLGVECLVEVPFTEVIMTMSPESYVKDLLIDKLRARQIYCGFNHNFGYKAKGNPKILKEVSSGYGTEVFVMDAMKIDGELVSSSLIRRLIREGRVDLCPKYMGRFYGIMGEVVLGNKLGRKIGFPTSNLMIDRNMVTPPDGVYVSYCTYEGKSYPSVTNVGRKPTIGNYDKNVETYIFDFDKILYGKEIEVKFMKKMRDELKFADIKTLTHQMQKDIENARKFHEKFDSEKIV